MSIIKHPRTIHSFARRQRRLTSAQQFFISQYLNLYHLENSFDQKKPLVLEIGFGMGDALLKQAQTHPHLNFLGIEVHLAGVAALLQGIVKNELKNIRIAVGDCVDILTQYLPNHCLDKIQIFFPDPWPKRKHNKRRLINKEFTLLIHKKLKPIGELHLATDWEDYAKQMLQVLNTSEWKKVELSHLQRYSTKFEQKGLNAGRKIYDFLFIAN